MLKLMPRNAMHRKARSQIKQWTRDRFSLPGDATVFVSEVACAVPGCPPVETVVAFWTTPETRHHFKIFKPVTEVIEDDIPPRWMKNALVANEAFGCECC
jgi:hypothetical protein